MPQALKSSDILCYPKGGGGGCITLLGLFVTYQIKMIGYVKEPHTSMFISQTSCGKTNLVLELIEKEYNKTFDYIIIICPTLRENDKTYHAKEWIKDDDNILACRS